MKKTTFAALVICFALASCLPASTLTPTHLTPDTSHLTLDTSHLTPDTSHLTPSPTPLPPTETPTPTATATPEAVQIEGCTTAKEALSKCVVEFEQINGKSADEIFDLEEVEFPVTAYNSGRIFIMENIGNPGAYHLTWALGKETAWDGNDYRREPEKYAPYRFVPGSWFAVVDENGTQYIGRVQVWKNPSGKISYLKYLTKYGSKSIEIWDQMAVGWPVFDLDPKYKQTYEDLKLPIMLKILFDEETNKLIHEWQETGEIPDALEEKVLVPLLSTIELFMPLAP